jgi:hypothetical protein
MHARRPSFCALRATRPWLGVLASVALLVLAGCGDEPASEPGEGPDWSDPAGSHAQGSPDGDGTTSAEVLLAKLRGRVAEGSGHADPSFERDVGDVAAVLWAPDPESGALEAARVHMQVANIAGEVGRWLAASESARAERTKSHPTDVALHDAFLAAAAKGPDVYRAWCAGEGARLLEEHADARYAKLFPPR